MSPALRSGLLALFTSSSALLAGLVAGCSSSSDEGASSPPPAPTTPANPEPPPGVAPAAPKLETVACRFLVPKSAEGKDFHCADLTVPESRRAAGGRTIKLHVAIMKGKEGGVPTIELVGGPGGSSEGLVGAVAAKTKRAQREYGKILEKGDLVLFDQRGTGRSIPRLYCDMQSGEELTACRVRLEKDGADLSAYDTIENADDVHDLKTALGVPKVDLHGISYGTRLGIEIMKRHGDDVRAAIIDGVMPPDVPVLGTFEIALDSILSQVFTACAADTKCNATYPALEDTFSKVKTKLDAAPFKAKGRFGAYEYDWDAFTGELIQRSYAEGEAAKIPHWLTSLKTMTEAEFQAAQDKAEADAEKAFLAQDKEDEGNPLAAELLERQKVSTEDDYQASDMAYGMYLSVTCNDYAQHESLDAAKEALTKVRPELRSVAMVTDEFVMCDSWAKRPSDPSVRAPSTFAGPVLVIGGKLDPATPYTWAEHVSQALPADQLIEVPTGGHGLMDECGAALKGGFLLDPQKPVDGTCATNRTLAFYYPDANQGLGRSAHHTGPGSRYFPGSDRTGNLGTSVKMSRVAMRVLASVGANGDALAYRERILRHRLANLTRVAPATR